MQYQTNGNIGFKTDAGNYSYHVNKKNAVVQVNNPIGDISSNVQGITYTPFNSVGTIIENPPVVGQAKQLTFTYAADQQRRKMEHKVSGNLQKTNYYFGNYEKIKLANGDITELHYIAGGDGLAAIHVITTPNTQTPTSTTFYTYTDHLGSILTLTDEDANLVYEQNFDAWGRERNPDTWDYSANSGTKPEWLTRGYTGHEHLAEFGLINMNGRLYDPVLGRMLSPDNYVQDVTSTQGFNRYSYVVNNPLKYTDPSGEFLNFAIGAVFGAISGWQIGEANGAKGWSMVGYIFGGAALGAASSGAAAGVSAIGGGVAVSGMAAGVTAGAGFSGMASNWNRDAMLKGAITGGISGFSGGLVGAAFGGGSGAFLGGAVGSGLNTKLNGGSNEDVLKAAGIGGATSLGLYHLSTYSNWKFRGGNEIGGLDISYRQFSAMQADFQRSRFWGKEYGGYLLADGSVNRVGVGTASQIDMGNTPQNAIAEYHTHWDRPNQTRFVNSDGSYKSVTVGAFNTSIKTYRHHSPWDLNTNGLNSIVINRYDASFYTGYGGMSNVHPVNYPINRFIYSFLFY